MTKKWIAINLMLLLCAGLLGRQLYVSAMRFNVENDPAKIQATKKKVGPEGGLAALSAPRKYNGAEFSAIAAQNLFAEARKLESKTEAAPPPEPPALDYKPIITAVVLSGSQRVATIIDPATPNQPASRRGQIIRPGDTYRGYVVTDISEDGMVLEFGTRREIIPLHDVAKHPLQGGKTPILATRIVNFGAGAAGASSAPGMGAPATAVVGGRAAAVNPAANVARPNQPAGGGGGGGRGSNITFQQGVAGPSGQTTLAPSQFYDAQGRLILRTPFGDVVQQQAPPQQPVKK